jgi:hypothetical protein
MLRTSNILVSSSWKRLSAMSRNQLRQNRSLSSKESTVTNKPTSGSQLPSSKLPPKGGDGGGGGFFVFTVTAAAGIAYLAYEKENGNATAEHIASQPYVNLVVDPMISLLKAAGFLPPVASTPAAPAAEKESYHHKTTEEVIQESHKQDPYVLPDQPAATKSERADKSKEVDSVITTEEEEEEEEEVELPVNNTSSIEESIAESVFNELHYSTASSSDSVDSSQALAETTEPQTAENNEERTESHTVASNTLLPEVATEISLHSTSGASSTAASRDILQAAIKSSVALRQELEQLMLKDVQNMDATALRVRVTQLATELFERLSWENLRLNHAMTQVEEEMRERYERLLKKQRQELEFEVEKLLFEKDKALAESSGAQQHALEEKYAQQMQQAIKAQAEGFQATLQQSLKEQEVSLLSDFQSQANQHHAFLRKQHNDELLQTQQAIESLRQEVQAAQQILQSLGTTMDETIQSHSIATAILTLESMLSQPAALLRKSYSMLASASSSSSFTNSSQNHSTAKSPIKEQWDHVRSLAQGDALVVSIVQSLPARVQENDALTVPELQVRFAVMREEARKAALAPEQAPKMLGQLIGTVLAKVSSSPSGYLAGPGVEECLARAAFHLERGKLKDAVREVASMEGYAKVLAQDWLTLAQDRLLVDQAVCALKADSILRHRRFTVSEK